MGAGGPTGGSLPSQPCDATTRGDGDDTRTADVVLKVIDGCARGGAGLRHGETTGSCCGVLAVAEGRPVSYSYRCSYMAMAASVSSRKAFHACSRSEPSPVVALM